MVLVTDSWAPALPSAPQPAEWQPQEQVVVDGVRFTRYHDGAIMVCDLEVGSECFLTRGQVVALAALAR